VVEVILICRIFHYSIGPPIPIPALQLNVPTENVKQSASAPVSQFVVEPGIFHLTNVFHLAVSEVVPLRSAARRATLVGLG
jgi:hypothetical protein